MMDMQRRSESYDSLQLVIADLRSEKQQYELFQNPSKWAAHGDGVLLDSLSTITLYG